MPSRHKGKIRKYEKRFGMIAVKKGVNTRDQLVEALETPRTENLEGRRHRLIGQILFARGGLRVPQIDEVLDAILGRTGQEAP
jgi:hypothetical protein